MARPKPQTNFYINYGPVNNTSSADSLAPVFIAPRYAVHNSAYGNAAAGAAYTGDSLEIPWPGIASSSIVDTATASITFENPTVALTASSGELLLTSAANDRLTAAVPVAGSGAYLQGGYELRAGDSLYLVGGASSGTFGVTSVGRANAAASGGITAADATVATSANLNYTNFSGTETAVYHINAVVISSGAEVQANVIALQGDPNYSATLTFTSGGVTSVGNFGATLGFTGIKASGAGVYTMSCTAAGTNGAFTQIYLDRTIAGWPSTANGITGTVYTANLIPGAVEVGNQYVTKTSTAATIASGAAVSFNGANYPVVSCAEVFANYRELLQDDAYTLQSAQTVGIESWVGAADPANPMGMLYAAGTETGYTNFYMMSVPEDTNAAYAPALWGAAKNEVVYALVPLRQTAAVLAEAKNVLAYYSDPSISQVKRLWVYNQVSQNRVELATDDTTTVLATVVGGALSLTSGSFADTAVKQGTQVALRVYNADTGSYDTINTTVTARTSDTACTVAYTGTIAQPSPAVFTNLLNHTEYAEAIAAAAQAINNHRINYIFAEPTTISGYTAEDPRYLTAELSAMRAAMAPHAPLTDVPIPGASIADAVGFTEADYDIMNNAGVWICYRDRRGNMVTRHAITTGKAGTIAEEDSAVSNGDNIVRYVRQSVAWLNGQCNVTAQLINKLTVSVYDALNSILSRNYSDLIGPQIISIDAVDIKQDPNNSAGVIANIDLDLPDVYLDGEFTFNLF